MNQGKTLGFAHFGGVVNVPLQAVHLAETFATFLALEAIDVSHGILPRQQHQQQ